VDVAQIRADIQKDRDALKMMGGVPPMPGAPMPAPPPPPPPPMGMPQ
jgi:hypothetical protein